MPMVINMFAYWALGFPLAYMAAITYHAPPSYIWAAFALALSVAAIMLTLRLLRISKDQVLAMPSVVIPD
jgi:MATE family multidrug resistance protein